MSGHKLLHLACCSVSKADTRVHARPNPLEGVEIGAAQKFSPEKREVEDCFGSPKARKKIGILVPRSLAQQ